MIGGLPTLGDPEMQGTVSPGDEGSVHSTSQPGTDKETVHKKADSPGTLTEQPDDEQHTTDAADVDDKPRAGLNCFTGILLRNRNGESAESKSADKDASHMENSQDLAKSDNGCNKESESYASLPSLTEENGCTAKDNIKDELSFLQQILQHAYDPDFSVHQLKQLVLRELLSLGLDAETERMSEEDVLDDDDDNDDDDYDGITIPVQMTFDDTGPDDEDQAPALPVYPVGPVSTAECIICLEFKSLNLRPCCAAAACKECLSTMCEVKVQSGVIKVTCVNTECDQFIHRDEVMDHLSSSLKEKFYKFLIDANKDPHIKTCPTCSSVKKMDPLHIKGRKIRKHGLQVVCEKCDLKWCFICHAPWHNGISCKEYQRGDKLLKAWAKRHTYGQTNAQKCPRCKIFIQRTTGCDHMSCSHCHTEFCYRCGERFREIRFIGDHYSRLSVFGCKYRLMPNKPGRRRLIRGAVLGGKLLAAPLVCALAVGVGAVLLGSSVVVLPAYGGYKLHVKLQERKRIKRNLEYRDHLRRRLEEIRKKGDPYLEQWRKEMQYRVTNVKDPGRELISAPIRPGSLSMHRLSVENLDLNASFDSSPNPDTVSTNSSFQDAQASFEIIPGMVSIETNTKQQNFDPSTDLETLDHFIAPVHLPKFHEYEEQNASGWSHQGDDSDQSADVDDSVVSLVFNVPQEGSLSPKVPSRRDVDGHHGNDKGHQKGQHQAKEKTLANYKRQIRRRKWLSELKAHADSLSDSDMGTTWLTSETPGGEIGETRKMKTDVELQAELETDHYKDVTSIIGCDGDFDNSSEPATQTHKKIKPHRPKDAESIMYVMNQCDTPCLARSVIQKEEKPDSEDSPGFECYEGDDLKKGHPNEVKVKEFQRGEGMFCYSVSDDPGHFMGLKVKSGMHIFV